MPMSSLQMKRIWVLLFLLCHLIIFSFSDFNPRNLCSAIQQSRLLDFSPIASGTLLSNAKMRFESFSHFTFLLGDLDGSARSALIFHRSKTAKQAPS